jgi:lipopolysaccharide biosynthesis glycosyltransferase
MDWNQYVNSGVLVLNLERIRKEHRLLDEAVAFWDTYGMAFPDQDAINYILRGKIRHLPAHLNMPSKDLSVEKNGVLYHYSYCRGLNDAMSPVDKLYLSYWQRSPFYKPEYGKHDKAMFLMQLKNRLDVYLRLEKLQPLDKEEAFHLGRCLYLRGCFQEAYESLLNDKIDTTREWKLDRAYWLSLSLESLQRKPEAISLIQQTLTGCAEKPYMEHDIREMGLSNLAGRLCYEEKQYEEAVSALKQCLFFGTEEKREVAICALQYLIKCTIRISDFAAAERYHNMALTLAPMNESVKLSGLRLAYEKQRRMQD